MPADRTAAQDDMARLPPLNALVVFEAAARHQSFTRAADSLHVTQAAVSHQIKTLENWLGVPLFQRLGRGQGLVLTDAGRNYLARISAALDGVRTATGAIMDQRRRRVLRIGTLDSFGSLWLVPRLARFIEKHPEVDVRLLSEDLDTDFVTMGTVDLDIRYGEGDWRDLEAVRFLTESVFPVCAPALADGARALRSPEDLRHQRLLHDVMVVDWRAWLDAAGLGEHVDAERGPGFNHSHMVINAAINGDGIALGRGALVADALRAGTLIKPFALSLPSRFAYFVVGSRTTLADPVVAAFRDWLVAEGAAAQRELDAVRDIVVRGPAQPAGPR
jgi:LysR family transcriptional regulator, glycine cleavage system transcriptional activator